MKYSDKDIEQFLEDIHAGRVTKYALDEDLYYAIADYYKKALYKGFGGTLADFGGKDLDVLEELRTNCYLFAGAKNYHLTDTLHEQLFNEEGDVITLKEFQELGRQTFDLWVDTWGETEYNTTLAQAENASKWNAIEKDKDILPNLRYSAIVDENTSEICLPLDGLVAPVDDPIWDTISPENHYNCRCILIQESADVDTNWDEYEDKIQGEDGVISQMNDAFKFNPGRDRMIWSKDHPYFDVPKEDKQYAKNNFNLPIPKKDE